MKEMEKKLLCLPENVRQAIMIAQMKKKHSDFFYKLSHVNDKIQVFTSIFYNQQQMHKRIWNIRKKKEEEQRLQNEKEIAEERKKQYEEKEKKKQLEAKLLKAGVAKKITSKILHQNPIKCDPGLLKMNTIKKYASSMNNDF